MNIREKFYEIMENDGDGDFDELIEKVENMLKKEKKMEISKIMNTNLIQMYSTVQVLMFIIYRFVGLMIKINYKLQALTIVVIKS